MQIIDDHPSLAFIIVFGLLFIPSFSVFRILEPTRLVDNLSSACIGSICLMVVLFTTVMGTMSEQSNDSISEP